MEKKRKSKKADSKQQLFKYKKQRKKVCMLCIDKKELIDYKNISKLKKFVSERGKILSSKLTGCCAKHQRQITRAVKVARGLALLPYVVK